MSLECLALTSSTISAVANWRVPMVPELQAWAVGTAVEGAEGKEADLAAATSMEAVVKEDMAATTMATGCKTLGDVNYYLGLHIERDVEKRWMRVHQKKYLEALAANFGKIEGHVATPLPSGFKCVAAGERVAKYLGQTATVGLQYSAAAQRRQKGADGVEPGRLFLTAFSDASWASEPEDMTSVGGFICCVGGGPTAWESKKQ
ncbi:hypothetical protein CLOM_g10554 [Closterium sp. NIES-68]|nr:hypothetical protein CLOM_g10554 [Closterium sp. NIES-68]